MNKDHSAAWGDFWADNAESGGGGCLPSAWQGIDGAQQAAWRKFAQHLPRKTRLLDIATGDGRVMGWLLKSRKDLKPVGCDLAATLPTPPSGTKVRGGVAMEELPYHDDAFGAVTSQFGFEYGQTGAAAAEIARILKPGGVVGLMTHRIDGPILAHNLARREQINWVFEQEGLMELAKRSLALRAGGLATIPSKILQAPQSGAAKFGRNSAAWEISEAILQSLQFGQRDRPENVARLLDTIRAKAQNELGRIASLEAACQTTGNAERFLADVSSAGLRQFSVEPLAERSGDAAFADFRLLQHAA